MNSCASVCLYLANEAHVSACLHHLDKGASARLGDSAKVVHQVLLCHSHTRVSNAQCALLCVKRDANLQILVVTKLLNSSSQRCQRKEGAGYSGQALTSGSDRERKRILSRASEALEMISRRKISFLVYRLLMIMSIKRLTSAWNSNFSEFSSSN